MTVSGDRTPIPPRRIAIVVLLAMVIAGGVVGAAVDRLVVRAHAGASVYADTSFHPISSLLRSPTDEERRQRRTQLADELRLTPAQALVVDSILDAHAAEFRQLREQIRPRVEQLTTTVRADVERALTPEQRDRYRKLLGQTTATAHDTAKVVKAPQ